MSQMIPIPKFVWESLESAIRAESRRLVREIANTLKKDESALWKEVSKDKITAYCVDLQDPTTESFQCKAYSLEGPVQKPCGQPVIFGKSYCPHHCQSLLTRPSSALPKLRRLRYFDEELDDEREVYLDQATNEVYDKETMEKIGQWLTESKSLLLFQKV
jgi:hypothetical protein